MVTPGFSAEKSLHGSSYVFKRNISGADSGANTIIPMCDISCWLQCLRNFPGLDTDYCNWACMCNFAEP